jgi:hypothetical protein
VGPNPNFLFAYMETYIVQIWKQNFGPRFSFEPNSHLYYWMNLTYLYRSIQPNYVAFDSIAYGLGPKCKVGPMKVA